MTGALDNRAILRSDNILPSWFSLRLPVTGSQHIAVLCSSGLALLLYTGSGMSLSTVSYVFSIAFLFQLLLVSFVIELVQDCLTLNDEPLVRSVLSPSQTETTPLVTSTTLRNARPSHGICCRNRDLGGQCCTRVRARASYNTGSRLPVAYTVR